MESTRHELVYGASPRLLEIYLPLFASLRVRVEILPQSYGLGGHLLVRAHGVHGGRR